MIDGAICLIDALGFKGIWEKVDSDIVLNKLEYLEQVARGMQEGLAKILSMEKAVEVPKPKVLLFSDSIAIGSYFESKQAALTEFDRFITILACTYFIIGIIQAGTSKMLPHFAYRGCISAGLYNIKSSFIVGPAVDDAANNMHKANGALIWLTPNAMKAVSKYYKLATAAHTLLRYRIPMNNGQSYESLVVNPLINTPLNEDPPQLLRSILDTFANKSNSLDIAIKKQNTSIYLNYAINAKTTPEGVPFE